MEEHDRSRGDLVLAQGEYALVQDGASGDVEVVVGPNKTSLAEADSPCIYNGDSERFIRCSMKDAIDPWPAAKEDQYVVLINPAQGEEELTHPNKGKQSAIKLVMGRTVNVPGPTTFALYPGQLAKVIEGHILRSNQYLVVRVINGDEAMKNWQDAVLKPAEGENKGEGAVEVSKLVTGQLLIIKGTEISFFIPPTGVEVEKDDGGNYVRDAATLEQLEYCILLDESGTKEFKRGPAVIFPKPTQTFIKSSDGLRKFKAIELNELMGIYVKIIKPYDEYTEGEELFLTGKEQRIYFPRPEHSIIKYGDQLIHYAVAIPKGESRYVLNRETGDVDLVEGPLMFLPDPRKEVLVRRALDASLVRLLYPGNETAIDHNVQFTPHSSGLSAQALRSMTVGMSTADANPLVPGASAGLRASYAALASEELPAEEFARSESFTPPRVIQLNTKYEGAVTIRVWTGYAIKIVSKTGDARIVVGPKTVMLDYDETPELFELSTGKPKNDDRLHKDVYLRVFANTVSDKVNAETNDFVRVELPISYRVNFAGDEKKWFDVENYVKFLTDHLRSLIVNEVKKHGVEEFYQNYIDILRDAILGVSAEDGSGRTGRAFDENGMCIYDVELGQIVIGDGSIAQMLANSQHEMVQQALTIAKRRRDLSQTIEVEKIVQDINDAVAKTDLKRKDIEKDAIDKELIISLAQIASDAERAIKEDEIALTGEDLKDQVHALELVRQKEDDAHALENSKAMTIIETESFAERVKAVTPDLIAAIHAQGDTKLAAELAKNIPTGGLFQGEGVDWLISLVKGTGLEQAFTGMIERAKARDKSSDSIAKG